MAKAKGNTGSDGRSKLSTRIKAVESEILAIKKQQNDENDKTSDHYKELEAKLEKRQKLLDNLLDTQEKEQKIIEQTLSDTEELDKSLRSIGNVLGKNSAIYKQHEQRVIKINATTRSITAALQANSKIQGADKDNIIRITKAYQSQQASIGNIQKEIAKGNLSREEGARMIQSEVERFEDLRSEIVLSKEAGEQFNEVIGEMVKESDRFSKSSMKTQQAFQDLDNVMGNFSGIPAMQELNTLLKTNTAQTLAFKAAAFALGAALATAAYDYFGAPIKATLQAGHEERQNRIDGAKDIAQIENKFGFFRKQQEIDLSKTKLDNAKNIASVENEARYASQKAAIAFSSQMQQGASQFKAAAKTAMYGGQMGPTGYNTAELNLAGIDPGQIVQSMSQLASVTGKVPTEKLATDMTLLAKRTGQSTDNIASLTEYFQRADNLSSETALNMVEGMRAMAKASKLDLGNLMSGVEEASKNALSYQIKSGEALAKQVAAAQSIGVNFNKIAGAGRNMVMNYKDSIKAEMQLSSQLGRSVNLSEVRQKAMSGDYEGMMAAMKAQGLDPSQMNMFQQDALQQALGGMDLDSIEKIYKGEIKTPADLKKGDAAKGGKEFLKDTKAAQSALSSETANISARQAVIDAKLSADISEQYLKDLMPGGRLQDLGASFNQMEKDVAVAQSALDTQINSAFLKSAGYNKYLADSMKEGMVNNFLSALQSGLVATIGGVLGTKLLGIFSKGNKAAGGPGVDAAGGGKGFFGKITGMFGGIFGKSKKQTNAPAPTQPTQSPLLSSLQGVLGQQQPQPTPSQSPPTIAPQVSQPQITLQQPEPPKSVFSGLLDQFGQPMSTQQQTAVDTGLSSLPLPVPVEVVNGDGLFGGGAASSDKGGEGKSKGFFAKIGERISGAWKGVTGFFGKIGERISGAWKSTMGFFSGIGERIAGAWKGVTGFFSNIFQSVGEKLTGAWTSVTGFFSGIGERIGAMWTSVKDFFTGIFESIGTKIMGAWETVTGWFSGIGTRIRDGWNNVVTSFREGIGGKIKEGWEKVVKFFKGIVETVQNFFRTKIAGIFKKGGLKSMMPGGGGGGAAEGGEGEGGGQPPGMLAGVSSIAKKGGGLGAGLSKLGKGLGDFIGSVGKGAGAAIEGILKGLANGIQAFANPQVAIGGAVIAGIIIAIGAAIAGAAWLMGKALPTLSEGLMSFNNVDGMNLLKVAAGVTALGAGLAAMGVGSVVAGVGNLVGNLFGGGIEDTIKKVEAFSAANIDEGKVRANSNAIIQYSKAMAALGAGSAVEGIGSAIGAIGDSIAGWVGGQSPIEKLKTFASYDIKADQVIKNADAAIAYAKAMAALGGGSAVGGIGAAVGAIGEGIAKWFGSDLPIDKFKKFASTDILGGGSLDILKKNAEAYTLFGQAMGSYKGSGTMSDTLSAGVAKFFGVSVEPPMDKFQKFASKDILGGGSLKQLKSNAEAYKIFGEAMSSYKGSSGGIGEVLAQAVGSFLKVESPYDKFQKFAAISGIDVEQTKRNAEAFTAFGNAMSTYKGADEGFFSSLGKGIAAFFGGGTDIIGDFQRFAAIDASGADAVTKSFLDFSSGMTSFNVDGIKTAGAAIEEFVNFLDDGEAEKLSVIGSGLNSVSSPLTTFGSAVSKMPDLTTFGNSFKGLVTALTSDDGFVTALSAIGTKLNPLITTFQNLASTFDAFALSLQKVSSINVQALNEIPWQAMHDFAATGGGNFNITLQRDEKQNIDLLNGLTTIATQDLATRMALDNRLNLMYKGQNGIWMTTAMSVKMHNRLQAMLPIQTEMKTKLNEISKGINTDTNRILKESARINFELQSTMVTLLEGSTELLSMIADNTDGDGKQTNIVLNGKKLSTMLSKYDANAKGRAATLANKK